MNGNEFCGDADDEEFTVTLTKTQIDTIMSALKTALRQDSPERLAEGHCRLCDIFDNVQRGC